MKHSRLIVRASFAGPACRVPHFLLSALLPSFCLQNRPVSHKVSSWGAFSAASVAVPVQNRYVSRETRPFSVRRGFCGCFRSNSGRSSFSPPFLYASGKNLCVSRETFFGRCFAACQAYFAVHRLLFRWFGCPSPLPRFLPCRAGLRASLACARVSSAGVSRETQKICVFPACCPVFPRGPFLGGTHAAPFTLSSRSLPRRTRLCGTSDEAQISSAGVSQGSVLQYSVPPAFSVGLPAAGLFRKNARAICVFSFRSSVSVSPPFWTESLPVLPKPHPFFPHLFQNPPHAFCEPPTFHVKHFPRFSEHFPPFPRSPARKRPPPHSAGQVKYSRRASSPPPSSAVFKRPMFHVKHGVFSFSANLLQKPFPFYRFFAAFFAQPLRQNLSLVIIRCSITRGGLFPWQKP